MVQTIQAKDITLLELETEFRLQFVEDEQFFTELFVELPEITQLEKQQLDRVKASYANLLKYPPLLENTVKMVVLSPLLDLADFYRRGRGEGGREQGEQALPLGSEQSGAGVQSPALLGRLTGAEYKLFPSFSPLLPAPCTLASFYLSPFHVKSEKSVEIAAEDAGVTVKGQMDVLVLFEQLVIVVIESKQAAFSVEVGKAQILAYMLAISKPDKAIYGLITNGGSFIFVKLINENIPMYGFSRLFYIFNPGNELYTVLSVLKSLGQLARNIHNTRVL
jgi:hypothetical protein